jgi:hypothetical protein
MLLTCLHKEYTLVQVLSFVSFTEFQKLRVVLFKYIKFLVEIWLGFQLRDQHVSLIHSFLAFLFKGKVRRVFLSDIMSPIVSHQFE